MEEMKKLIKKHGSKKKVAALLQITPRYVDMILKGQYRPGIHLTKIIQMHL